MQRVKLGDVVERIKDKVDKNNSGLEFYIGGEHFDYGEICITRKGVIAGSTIGPAFHMHFVPGDVLLMSRNPHLRKAGMVDFEGICSDVSYVCRTKDENVLLQRFLPFIFQTDDFWEFAEANKKGSTNFFLNWSDFEKYEFYLADIETQEKLVDVLWNIQEVLQHERYTLKCAIDLRNSLYDKTQNEEYMLQQGFRYHKGAIGDEFKVCNSLRKPLSQAVRSEMQGEYPYWGPTGVLDSINQYRLDGEYALIGEDGDHFLKYLDWDMTHLINGKFNVNNHAHVIQGNGTNLTKWFFYYFKHRNIEQHLTKQGGGRLKLTKSVLLSLEMLIPDREVQEELCKKYDAMEEMIVALKDKVAATSRLLKDITENNLRESL